jgi:hypothetical protein
MPERVYRQGVRWVEGQFVQSGVGVIPPRGANSFSEAGNTR